MKVEVSEPTEEEKNARIIKVNFIPETIEKLIYLCETELEMRDVNKDQ